ncbi:putative c6 transcription factor [Phaeomoniella chlamydospora]|uniref:Putative c6 transcription factor n=1 Tax=Phaeomoniella chlamydospora TaxID=158046 RepID=A0A0G2E211_PHACM|nr:putative c6 transcription factor [Phaeomoniella chlamydospora]
MDRGAKQKAQAAEVKQIVAAARRGRMKRIQGQVDSTLKRGRESNSTADNDFNAHTATTLAPSRQTVADQETAAPSSPKAGFPYDSKQTPLDYRDDLMVADFISHSTTVWGLHSPLDETVPLFPNSWTFDDELNSPHELHTEVHDVEPELVHNAEITIPQPYALTGKDASVTEDSSMLVIGNVEEAMLLAHYMDKVFSWQFQFSSLHQPDFSQGHIMWFITQSRTLYHATLALSSTHRSLQNNLKGISIDSVRAKRTCWLCHIDGDEQEASIKVKGTAKFFLVASIMRFDMLSSLRRCWDAEAG